MLNRSIVVVGSSNTDMILQLERIPRPGETILGGSFSIAAGGKGANQAVAAARAGGSVTFVARVGSDSLGEQAIGGFLQDGIDVTHVKRDATAPSGVALIFVARDGENSIGVASGANANLSAEDVQRAGQAISTASIVLAQLETPLPAVMAAADLASQAHLPFLLNPAPATPLPGELLRRITILTPNETEAELLTGIPVNDEVSARRAAQYLREQGVRNVIVTLGSRGALVRSEHFEGIIPAFVVKAIDTTAAGDVFNGSLAVALAEGLPLPQAVRFASAAAAISVTRLGAQPSAPRRQEIDAFLAAHSSES